MTDKEMLELAAKAAGLKILHGRYDWPAGIYISEPHNMPRWWNPLVDNACALLLAVKLNLNIEFDCDPDGALVRCFGNWDDFPDRDIPQESLGKLVGSSSGATRRAIVRAAAEIGRGM